MIYTEDVEFSKFIEGKYVEWRSRKVGNAGSAARYAKDVLGVEPYLLNDWMTRNKIPTSQEHIDKLIACFGVDEVYDMIGWPPSIAALPPEMRSDLAKALFEIRTAFTAESINDPESPRAEELASKIFAQHGFKSTKI